MDEPGQSSSDSKSRISSFFAPLMARLRRWEISAKKFLVEVARKGRVVFRRLLVWLVGKIWDWVAVLFIVTGLWTFGAIGIGATLSEPIPSAMEIAGAGTLIWLGVALLLARTLHSAWKATELTSVLERIVVTVFALAIFAFCTSFEFHYLSNKVPLLALAASDLVLHPIGPPPESPSPTFESRGGAPVPLSQYRKPIAPTPQEPSRPAPSESAVQLTAEFINPESLSIAVYNPSDDVIENVIWSMVAFRTSDLYLFSFATQSIGYIKPHSRSANYSMALDTIPRDTEEGNTQLREGDELTGSVSIDCPHCSVQTYIIHLIWKQSGWYYESPQKGGYIVPKDTSKPGREQYIELLTGPQFAPNRIPIVLR